MQTFFGNSVEKTVATLLSVSDGSNFPRTSGSACRPSLTRPKTRLKSPPRKRAPHDRRSLLPGDLPALLGAFILKSLAVFALAGLALLGLRRASAASRHLVCLLTLAALLLLPVLSVGLPGWTVAALPLPAAPRPAPSTPPASAPIAAPTAPFDALPNSPTSPAPPPMAALPAPPKPFPWTSALLAAWLLGAFLASLRLLLGLWGIGRLHRDCRPVGDAPTLALAQECADALRLKRPHVLWQADVPVPMTWGTRRPVVLLPLTAETWPADRLQAVLLHEMAHVRRADWPSHRLADVVCALYWFHPFAWATARRLRAEGEIACDDLVLSSGVAAPDYARHLLDVARGLQSAPVLPQAALAMAQSTRLSGRVRLILDPNRRRVLTRPARILLVALAFGLILSIATAYTQPRSLMAALTSGGFPTDTPAHAEAEVTYLEGQIQRFSDKDPWAGKAYYVLGNAQVNAGHTDAALASFDKAIALPEPPYANSGIHSSARYERINTLDAPGHYAEAVRETEALLKNGGRGLITAGLWENLRERLPEFKMLRDDAANRAAEKGQYAALTADTRWTRTLANGATVELLGVMASQGDTQIVWSPSGRLLSCVSYKPLSLSEFAQPPNRPEDRRFILRFRHPSGQAILTEYKATDSTNSSYDEGLARMNGVVMTDEAQMNPETSGCRLVQTWFPQAQKQTGLRVGVALVSPPFGPNDPTDAPKEWIEFDNVALQLQSGTDGRTLDEDSPDPMVAPKDWIEFDNVALRLRNGIERARP